MLPREEAPGRDGALNQHVYWSALHAEDTAPATLDIYTLIQEKNAPLEVKQSSRRSTDVLVDASNFSIVLELAFPLEPPTNFSTQAQAFKIFLACQSNSPVLDACFLSAATMSQLFTILQTYIFQPISWTDKRVCVDGISSFLFTGIKRQERLLALIDILSKRDGLLNIWVRCSFNHKVQEALLSFLSNYQTRSDDATDSIGALCREKDLMRKLIRRLIGVRSREDVAAAPDEADSYTYIESYTHILSHILHYNVPHLCEQILEHYNLILDRYSTAFSGPNPMLMLKVCGQLVVHMLQYLTVQSIAIHYKSLANVSSLPAEFIENRSDYLDCAIKDLIYYCQGKLSYETVPSGQRDLDDFESKYAPVFFDIVSKLIESISLVDSALRSTTPKGISKGRDLEVAAYFYLLYYAHAIGIANTSQLTISLFNEAGDLYDLQVDFLPRKLTDETGLREFMWSDMYNNDLLSLDKTMYYNAREYSGLSFPMLISPLVIYTQIVRQNKLSAILRVMKAYENNTLIQAVGTRIIMGVLELGISLSDRNHRLLEGAIKSICRFCLKDPSLTAGSQRSSSHVIAIKSIFREAMRLCTEVSCMMLIAVKYGEFAIDMEYLNEYTFGDGDADEMPRTLDSFSKVSDLKYSLAHAFLCTNSEFSRLATDLLLKSDIYPPLAPNLNL